MLLKRLTGFDLIEDVQRENPQAEGLTFVRACAERFNVKSALVNIKATYSPRTVFVVTHHTGALDFMALFPELSARVPNLRVVVNKKLLSLKPLAPLCLGVNTLSTGKSNQSEKQILASHLSNGGSLMIFPAGKVASKINGRVEDFPWRYGVGELILAQADFVVAVHVDAQNSNLFYLLRKLFPALSMLILLRELRAQKEIATVTLGEPLKVADLKHLLPQELIKKLKDITYQLSEQVRNL
jgi:putative hemolysin